MTADPLAKELFENHAPVPTESSPVPSDHRFRSDHNQDLFPSGGPEHVRQNPEGLIEYCEPWPGMPSLQRCELLAKGQVFKKQLAPSAEHAPNRSEQKRKQVHHVMLLSHLPCGRRAYPVEISAEQNFGEGQRLADEKKRAAGFLRYPRFRLASSAQRFSRNTDLCLLKRPSTS